MSSLSYDIEGSDVDGQLRALQLFPKVFDEKYRPGMKEAVAVLYGNVRPLIPTLSGSAQKALTKKVTGRGYFLTGTVGFKPVSGVPGDQSWYPNAVEFGAKAHLILPKNQGGVMAIGRRISTKMVGAAVIFARVIHHPGFPGRFFMKRGFEASRPAMNALFGRAGDAVVDALVNKAHSSGGGRVGYNR